MWRILVLFLLVLTALYVCLLMYFRTAHRERLIARWASELRVGDRNAFINDEMTGYMKSLKLWLAVVIYIVPIGVGATLIYVQNFM
jgi:phosphatidylglycerophosphatase A